MRRVYASIVVIPRIGTDSGWETGSNDEKF
jgi:hypothetical protein